MKVLFLLVSLSLAITSLGQNTYSIIHDYNKNPVYTPPFDLIYSGLSTKQSEYNRNVQSLYQKVDEILSLHKIAYEKGAIESASRKDYMRTFLLQLEKFKEWDFSSSKNYSIAMTYLGQIRTEIYKWCLEK